MRYTASAPSRKLVNSAAMVSPPGSTVSMARTSMGYVGKNAARASSTK